MSINQNASLDASQVEDMRNQAAKAAGLADLPDPEEAPENENEDDEESPS